MANARNSAVVRLATGALLARSCGQSLDGPEEVPNLGATEVGANTKASPRCQGNLRTDPSNGDSRHDPRHHPPGVVRRMIADMTVRSFSDKTQHDYKPPQNRLLASLSNADFERLRPHLEPVRLKRSLYEVNKPIEFVYFLETGVSSLVNTMANGDASEVGTIGNEGVVGLPILLGDQQAPTSVYMQVPGAGLRMTASLFNEELLQSASLRTAMHHYVHAFFNQVAQSAACAHFHSLEQRCCRWLLMTHDRMQSDSFY